MIDSVADADVLLRVRDVTVRFGGIVALDGISFDVRRGGICGVIGPNGAGKTTLFNCLSRLYTPTSGHIEFDGAALLSCSVHEMAGLGLGRTFQNVALFPGLTVRDNILVGGHCQGRAGYWPHLLRLSAARREEQAFGDRADELIGLMALGAVSDRPAVDLPFGTRKRVELARALMARPKLLLLDEPAAGLSHEEVDALRHLIEDVRERFQVTVLLVEHHLNLVMRVSDQVVAMNFGRKIADGCPQDVQADPAVVEAYLGAPA